MTAKFNRYVAVISDLETEEAKSLTLLRPKIKGLKQHVLANWGESYTSISVAIFGLDWIGNRFPIHKK